MIQIKNIALDNKYTKWYCSIIEKALSRATTRQSAKKLLGYIEGHHIIPKCFKLIDSKDKLNIVYLTAKEHFVVHHLLCKMFDDKRRQYQMANAFMKMCCFSILQKREIISVRFYDSARKEFSKSMTGVKFSQERKQNISNSRLGIAVRRAGFVHSNQTKLKISKSHTGKPLSLEHKLKIQNSIQNSELHKKSVKSPERNVKISNTLKKLYSDITNHPQYGKKHSIETRIKMSEAYLNMPEELKLNRKLKQSIKARQRIRKTCPHCSAVCSPGLSKRWHFNNCKLKLDNKL